MKAYFEYLNSLPEPLGVMLLLTNILIASGLFAVVFYYSVKWLGRERVVRYGSRYFVVKDFWSDKKYLTYRWGQPDWTYSRNYAGIWHDRDTALTHLTRPPGPYRRWKQKQEYKRVRAEQEARLKAHQEKMLKVRLDFSNYGGTD